MKISYNKISAEKTSTTINNQKIQIKQPAEGNRSCYDCYLLQDLDYYENQENTVECIIHFINNGEDKQWEEIKSCKVENFHFLQGIVIDNDTTYTDLNGRLDLREGDIRFILDDDFNCFVVVRANDLHGIIVETCQTFLLGLDLKQIITLEDPTIFFMLPTITPIKITSSDMYKDNYILIYGPRTFQTSSGNAGLDYYQIKLHTIYMLTPEEDRPVSNGEDKFYVLAILDYNAMQN